MQRIWFIFFVYVCAGLAAEKLEWGNSEQISQMALVSHPFICSLPQLVILTLLGTADFDVARSNAFE